MTQDIRDKAFITHDDVVGLNFIKNPGAYFFRRHFRQGLRSHIMEVLTPSDVALERWGTPAGGVRRYPKAMPRKIFRIFRARLKTVEKALDEIARVKIAERYLAPFHIAKSDEFIVDYLGPDGYDLMLCGLQTYEAGEILDPWSTLDQRSLLSNIHRTLRAGSQQAVPELNCWIASVFLKAAHFIDRIKSMILEQGHVPDLAGVGNLVLVPSGEIKLVDMNNISRVVFDATVRLDDRGYPVGDKSIEGLALLEAKLLGRRVDRREPVYRHFLDPKRKAAVRTREMDFYRRTRDV